MSPDTTTTAKNPENNDADIEMQHLVDPGCNDAEQGTSAIAGLHTSGPKKSEHGGNGNSAFQRLMLELDERCNINMLLRWWCPRLEFLVRLMLVSTFFDDSLHTALHFFEVTERIGNEGCLRWLVSMSPGSTTVKIVSVISAIALGIGVLAQFIGSICILARVQPNGATIALISWVIVQPVLYSQLSNMEFITESLSLIGGLLMLRAHLVYDNDARIGAAEYTKLVGRLLLPSMYLYYTGKCLLSAASLEETDGIFSFASSLSAFALNSIALVVGIISYVFVAAGLQSRLISLFLAICNLVFCFYQHPFFRYIYREDGHWEVRPIMAMPSVVVPEDVTANDFDLWQIYDLHRYYFFLGFSTSGALLLLAQLGPGKIAVQKDEVFIPRRAQD